MAKKNRFIFVDKKYYGDKKTAQYYADLAKEKEYVVDNINLVHVGGLKDKRKRRLEVRDKATGKRLSITKFKKYFNLSKHEINHLKSGEVEKLGVNDYFKFFYKERVYQDLLDTKDLDELKKYGVVIYNDEEISVNDLIEEIIEYEDRIDKVIYKFMLMIKIDGNEVEINLDDEIIEHSEGDIEGYLGYTDGNGNFILYSS